MRYPKNQLYSLEPMYIFHSNTQIIGNLQE